MKASMAWRIGIAGCAAFAALATCGGPAAEPSTSKPAAQEPAVVADGGERFDAACRFVSEGMVSYWFIDPASFPRGSESPAKQPEPTVIITAARWFEPPQEMIGTGPCDQVIVSDHGDKMLTPAALGWPVTPDELIAGQPVWHRSLNGEDKPATPMLSAIVEGRFLVAARRPLLVESLASHGDRHRLLRPFGETHGIDWAASMLVFCKPRPDVPGLMGEGRETCAIFVGTEKPWRVEGWYLDGKVRKDDGLPDRVSERRAGDYLVKTWDLEIPEHPSADDVAEARNTIGLVLSWAYGLRSRF